MNMEDLKPDVVDKAKQEMTHLIYLSAYTPDPLQKVSLAQVAWTILNALLIKKNAYSNELKERLRKAWDALNDAVYDYYDGNADRNWKDTWAKTVTAMRDIYEVAMTHDLLSAKVDTPDPSTFLRMTGMIKEG